ncbi:hypothetical protein MVES_000500 [Malassezia vespertilionis]|uniref:Uncharacterized protein n=2 Tax=Malassezia vespertilionis TaxID=2020962 RepID=A0A2N1JH89_9BASI|nr:hypothetical protein MVES_000500 [Malassezia vespertilionis]
MPGKEKGNGPRRYKGNRLFRPPSGLLSSVVCPEVTAASSTRTPSATHSTSDTSVVSQESVPDPAIPASGSGFSRVVYMHGSPPRSTRGDLSHSVSADALVPRTALDHLLASLDNDARRKGDPVCRSVSATTLSMETPLPSPPAVRAIPTPVGIDECAVSDTESDHSIESRHVYFDEQRLHKQSSLQVLRHEARMRRVAFQNATHYDKRYAMDSLMQTLQAQIEDAGSRLRGVPGAADQWSLQAPRAPCELSYTVRQTPRSRAPASLPTWQGPVNSARPFAFHLAISLTFHAPLLCRRAPTTASMRLVRVSLAHGFVLSAFHAKEARSGRAEPHDTRPNPVLLLLPRFVLV